MLKSKNKIEVGCCLENDVNVLSVKMSLFTVPLSKLPEVNGIAY